MEAYVFQRAFFIKPFITLITFDNREMSRQVGNMLFMASLGIRFNSKEIIPGSPPYHRLGKDHTRAQQAMRHELANLVSATRLSYQL